MIHFDTSFLVRAFISGTEEDRAFRGWTHDGEQFGVSAIAWAQFLCGPVSPDDARVVAALLDEPQPFDGDDASLAARLYNETGRRRSSFADCMIAAAALRAGASLATSDLRDFRRFEPHGLRLVSPT